MATQKERVHLELLATDNVSQPVDKAADSIRKFDREAQKANKQGLRLMRGGLGQVGHQIQDIAVQLQMGQNAMLVFGQQGSQIASLMGPNGALIGAVMAVGAALATAYAPAVIGARDRTKELQETFEDLSKVMRQDTSDGVFKLTEKFRLLANQSKDLAEIQLRGAYVKALHAANNAQQGFIESLDDLVAANIRARNAGAGQVNQFQKFAEAMGISIIEARNLRDAVLAVKTGQDGASDSLVKMINAIVSQEGALNRLTPEFIGIISKIIEFSQSNREATDLANELKNVMGDLNGVLETTSPEFKTLVESQNNFKESLKEQAETLGKSKEQILIYKAGLLGLADNQEVLNAIQAIIDKQNELDMAQGVEKLQKKLMTRKEVLSAAFDEEMQLLTEFAAADVANEQLAAELKIKAQENYYNKLEELRQKSKKFEDKNATEKTQMVLNGLGDAFKGVQANNKKMFAAQKAYNIAQAIMSTYTGATKAIETYPPPISFAMAAAQVAAGMAQIAQIRAQSFDGGGFTGSGSRSGGMDGKGGFPAILHPNETVIDHTKGQSGGITIINNIDAKGADANVDMKIRAAMQQSSQQTVATIQDLMRRRRFV